MPPCYGQFTCFTVYVVSLRLLIVSPLSLPEYPGSGNKLYVTALLAQLVENLPAVQETWSLGLEDHLEQKTAAHSSVLAWRIP